MAGGAVEKSEDEMNLGPGDIEGFVFPDGTPESPEKGAGIPFEVISFLSCLQKIEKKNSLKELHPENEEPCFTFGGSIMGIFSVMNAVSDHMKEILEMKNKGSVDLSITLTDVWKASPPSSLHPALLPLQQTAVGTTTDPVWPQQLSAQMDGGEVEASRRSKYYKNAARYIDIIRPLYTTFKQNCEMQKREQGDDAMDKSDLNAAVSTVNIVQEAVISFKKIMTELKEVPWPLLKGNIASLLEDITILEPEAMLDDLKTRIKTFQSKPKAPTKRKKNDSANQASSVSPSPPQNQDAGEQVPPPIAPQEKQSHAEPQPATPVPPQETPKKKAPSKKRTAAEALSPLPSSSTTSIPEPAAPKGKTKAAATPATVIPPEELSQEVSSPEPTPTPAKKKKKVDPKQ